MKTVKLKISGYDDRRKLVGILADSGYYVKVETEQDRYERHPRYYVCIEIEDKEAEDETNK